MDNLSTEKPLTQSKQGKTFLVIGIIILLLICICIVAAAVTVFSFRSAIQETAIPEVTPDAHTQVTVKEDGCSVERSEVEGATPVRMLTWVVTDLETDVIVLERVADDEYAYTYFAPGRYSIYLKAWYAGQYYPVSNEVNVNCK
jgi:flagellar basal body-associated protein FliL